MSAIGARKADLKMREIKETKHKAIDMRELRNERKSE
jgi:hypothetical protein